MNYAPDCADCPTPADCKAKNDCQVMRKIRHGRAEIEFFVPPVALPLAQGTPRTDQLRKAVEDAWKDGGYQFLTEEEWLDEYGKLEKDAQWAKSELLEIMRIVGSPADEDDIIRAIKLHGIRLLVEADHVKYESLIDDAAKAGS